jgi:hypothetical protein
MLRSYILLAIMIALMMPTASQAAGSYQKRPIFDHLVVAGVPKPKVTLPSFHVDPGQLLGGCGRGRIRDSQSYSCRGPGDISH